MGSVLYDGLLSAADDDFHAGPPHERWWHETMWFWFFVPERRLGGWLYNFVRPNIGISGGGCLVWDDTTWFHAEVPYYGSYSSLPVPERRDLRDFAFPSGTTVQVVEPLTRYHLGHRDREWIDVDLDWTAIMPPFVSVDPTGGVPHHFDQFGGVTGRLVLHGEEMAVDCLAMRDRSWSPRSERWKDGGGYGYTDAAASAELSFLHNGFLVIDGVRRDLVSERTVERDAEHGFVIRIRVVGTDTDGRKLEAEGVPVSRMAMPIPGVHAIVWTSLVDWRINGIPAWGEDQEPWPLNRWYEFRRSNR